MYIYTHTHTYIYIYIYIYIYRGRFKAKTADFTVKAELFNNTLKRLCSRIAVPNTRMSVLKHQRFNSMLPSLLCDGVHLTPEGLQRYYFSLRRGIVAALK